MMTPATAHLWQILARLAHADQQKNRPNQWAKPGQSQ